jgi:hypothetical protein
MPAHSSHLLQPLDIGCFGPLKRSYGGLIEAKQCLGFHHINKHDFLQAYPTARSKVFSIQNIQSGFRVTGILPFNPKEVLDHFNYSVKASEEATTPPLQSRPSTSSLVLATPYIARQIHQKASSIKKLLHKGS